MADSLPLKRKDDIAKKCLTVFKQGLNEELALQLLPLVNEPLKLTTGYVLSGTKCNFNHLGCTILHIAARNNGWTTVMKALIVNYQCNPETRDSKGRTALHYAASVGNINAVMYLVTQCGCDPNDTSTDGGMTSLHYAAQTGSFNVLKYLMETYGLDPLVTNAYGETCIHLAVHQPSYILEYLVNKCSSKLSSYHAKSGTTLLHVGAKKGSITLIKCVIGKCDPLERDKRGKTAYQYASIGRHYHIMKYLAQFDRS